MDSTEVSQGLAGLSRFADGNDATVVLNESLASSLSLIAQAIDADATPEVDVGFAGLRLTLLSDALSRSIGSADAALHYVVAMGLEQAGFITSTVRRDDVSDDPIDDDVWMRLALAILHYLAGNYRVQCFASLTRLRRSAHNREPYLSANFALRRLLEGGDTSGVAPRWKRILFEDRAPDDPVEAHLQRLASGVRRQRVMMLEQLGATNTVAWLAGRGVVGREKPEFWRSYIESLRARGIVAFSREQVGDGFDDWLRPGKDVLAVLPTGAGKSLVGELRTALTLTQRQSVLWLLPTRALVRQTQRSLRQAFRSMNVEVRELPVTEDPAPLFADDQVESGIIACTTPERASALFRAQPNAMASIGLVVLDEAQIIVSQGRGAAAERLVTELREATNCDRVLLTAFDDAFDALRTLLEHKAQPPSILRAPTRPSRRVYGVLTRRERPRRHVEALFYPPQRSEVPYGEPTFSLALRSRATGSNRVDSAMKFARATGSAGLRTVVFVNRKDSTEKHAIEFIADSESLYVGRRIPAALLPRLRLELGRESVIEDAMPRGALPHHAGLTRLEQHLVEQFILAGYVSTVVATPTLAQGVNLPLDIAVVTFLQRFSPEENEAEPIPPSELHNMLGRAGRAGMVPDGLCLIAVDERTIARREVLRRNRSWLYPSSQAAQAPGVIQLLGRLEDALSKSSDWLTEVDVVSFSDAQSILSFSATLALEPDQTALQTLLRFPSFNRLTTEEQERHAAQLTALTVALQGIASPREIGLIAKSGLPLQFIQHVVRSIDGGSPVEYLSASWWDHLVFEALGWERGWCSSLRLGQPRDEFWRALGCWRSGLPIADVEGAWRTAERDRAHRVKSGQFFNTGVSQVAQLWGIAPLAMEEFGLADLVNDEMKAMAAFVREGLPTVDGLIWRRAVGDLDRVLARTIAELGTIDSDGTASDRVRVAREQLTLDGDLMDSLDQDAADALRGNINEERIVADGV